MQSNQNKDSTSEYRIGGLTLLQLMGWLALIGLAVTCVLRWCFGS